MATAIRRHPLARLSAGRGLNARTDSAWARLPLAWGVALLCATAPVQSATEPGAMAASALPRAASAGSPALPSTAARNARPLVGCLIGPERVADIGTPVVGVVSKVKVDRGDAVDKGDALVLLSSGVEAAGVDAARSRASIDAEVRAAEANALLASQRHTRTANLVSEGFVTAQAAEQTRAERDVALQKLAQARGQHTVQRRELGQVQAQLAQRTLRSPFRGVVIERFVNPGERVDDKPLLRLAQLDPLRVELVLPANRWGSVATGDRVGVLPELPGAVPLIARVTHIDKVIDASSNTFRVRLALPNPDDKVPAGARCKVDAAFMAGAAAGPTDAAKGAAPLPFGAPSLVPASALMSASKSGVTPALSPSPAVPAGPLARRAAAARDDEPVANSDHKKHKKHKKKHRTQDGGSTASTHKNTARDAAASDSTATHATKKKKKKKHPAKVEA
ncbi:MAG: hypothetical protein RJA98_2459 [Pseudomonadota bacterium]|jgi:RND family efflux transporter MFP subunit